MKYFPLASVFILGFLITYPLDSLASARQLHDHKPERETWCSPPVLMQLAHVF